MQSARVALYEDDPHIQNVLSKTMAYAGHEVKLLLDRVDEATEAALFQLRPGSLDVAVVDANRDEGARVVEILNQVDPDLITVGFCGKPDFVRGAHFQLYKPEYGQLLTLIDVLPPHPVSR